MRIVFTAEITTDIELYSMFIYKIIYDMIENYILWVDSLVFHNWDILGLAAGVLESSKPCST